MGELVGLEESLKGALPVSFKAKPEERGSFARKAVDFSGEVLKERIAAINERISSFDKEAEDWVSKVNQAKEALVAAEAVRTEKTAALAVVDGDLLKAKEAQAAANAEVEAFTPRQHELQQQRSQAQAQLDDILGLLHRFKAMSEAKSEAVTEATPEASATVAKESDASNLLD